MEKESKEYVDEVVTPVNTKILTTYLYTDELEILEQMAQEQGKDISEVYRALVRDAISRIRERLTPVIRTAEYKRV